MADDWQPGDLALCVNDRHAWGRTSCLWVGGVYTVEAIAAEGSSITYGWCSGLLLVGVRSPARTGAFAVHRFRKIRPHTPDAEDEQTIRLLNGQPETVPA